MISRDIPVVWSLYSHNRTIKLYLKTDDGRYSFSGLTVNNHYVTATAVMEDGTCNHSRMIEISSWGKRYYIDFDAKECSSKTSFTLKNVHTHQYEHLKRIKSHGGIGFFLVSFNRYNEYYILLIEQFEKFYLDSLKDGRKSIPYEFFKENCIKVNESYKPNLDYLKGIDIIINRLM